MARSHEAQPCYCGEPKCVGFIGGKTQTDIGAMDDLYLDGMASSIFVLASRIITVLILCSAWYHG